MISYLLILTLSNVHVQMCLKTILLKIIRNIIQCFICPVPINKKDHPRISFLKELPFI